ncbi:MAG: type transport system ATP-binding protein [Actinomycetota bacterium]|jgi:ABC-2 type transport system ATP-binding protein|nr:type transport system ATP-binding protein [Actinomycetota bacterium]
MARSPAYEVRDLRKVYPSPPVIANDGITFTVSPGEAFGLLGPNGAGKTTLVRQLVGLMRPTSGEIKLFGEPIRKGRRTDPRLGRTVAYLPQGSLAQGDWKVAEAISWTGRLRGCSAPTARRETEDLLRDLELTSLADRQLRKLSGGQRRLVQIGMTLVGRLPVLILDEPTTDIDPVLRRRIWSLISDRAKGGASVILVTHDVAEAEHALDRVAILDRGRMVAVGTPAELKSSLAHRTRLEVVVAEERAADPYEIAALIGSRAKVEGRRVSGWVPADEAVRILEKVVAEATPAGLEDVRLVTPTLEDVYLETAGRGFEAEAETE